MGEETTYTLLHEGPQFKLLDPREPKGAVAAPRVRVREHLDLLLLQCRKCWLMDFDPSKVSRPLGQLTVKV